MEPVRKPMISSDISVVIPCFNEEKNILGNIKKIHSYLENSLSPENKFEIIAVNDGSTDETKIKLEEAAACMALTVIDNPVNEGKGSAVRDGILKSRHEVVMFLDADLAIPIEELEKFLEEIKRGNDLVIASRFVPGLRIRKPVLWYRKIMENVFRLIRMAIINNFDIRDTQCGFKVFRRTAAEKIFSRTLVKKFAFDAEVIFLAKKMGFKIKELPITLQNPRESHIRILRDPLNMINDLFRIKKNYYSGKYKL